MPSSKDRRTRTTRAALSTPAAKPPKARADAAENQARSGRNRTKTTPDSGRPTSSAQAFISQTNYGQTTFVPSQASPVGQDGQIGAPGNLNVFGFLTGEDYNQDLDGRNMFEPYQKMRLSDAQVNATLAMLKLPLKGARWIAKAASDDPQDIAIADFVQANLIDDDALARPWQSVLDNAMLKFDFGCAAHEIVWDVEEEQPQQLTKRGQLFHLAKHGGDVGRIALADAANADGSEVYAGVKDLAPRLPKTFYRWILDERTGNLKFLEQFAPKTNGAYQYLDIPATSLVRHCRAQEGNNFWGRAVLRTAYPHWWRKQQLYNIDMIGHDRFHVGIPRAKLLDTYNATKAPLDKIEQTLKGLRSHDRAYMVQPYGVEYDIYAADRSGQGTSQIVQSIEHHNLMIARNILQSFAAQGEQRHGSFGAASVTADVYFQALNGEALEIGSEIKNGVVKQLCDLNFDMRGRGYPTIVPADLKQEDVSQMATGIASLVQAGVMTPEDDLEQWFRDLYNAPALPEKLQGRDRLKKPDPVVQVPKGFGQSPDQPDAKSSPKDPTEGTDGQQAEDVTKDGKASETVAASKNKQWVEGNLTFSRKPTTFERSVFALSKIPPVLNSARDQLADKLAAVRVDQLKTLAARLATKDVNGRGAFTDFRPADVGAVPGTNTMLTAIRTAQEAMRAYGAESVVSELQKQGASTIAAAKTAGATARVSRSALITSAQATVQKLSDTWLARILETAIRLRRSGLQGQDLIDAVYNTLLEEASTGVRRDASAEVNEAYAIGREAEILANQDRIEKVVYSCLLDENSCAVCEQWDGREMQVGDADYYASLPPNKDCEGNKGTPDACRCVHLAIYQQG